MVLGFQAIDMTAQTSIQLKAASKQRCEDRFDKEFQLHLATIGIATDSEERLNLDQVVLVLKGFGMSPQHIVLITS